MIRDRLSPASMIQAGVNDASYNCKGTPTWRPSQIIPVAVALWATKPRLLDRSASHPPSRQLRRGKQRSSYSAPRCRAVRPAT